MDIIPSYKCNMNCKFCYNSGIDKSNNILNLDLLKEKLNEVEKVDSFAIVGGEPSLLPKDYLYKLISILKNKNNKKPDFYTNFKNNINFYEDVNLRISYDPVDREDQDIVFENMLKLQNDFTINMIITKNLVEKYNSNDFKKLLKYLPTAKISLMLVENTIDNNYTDKPDPKRLLNFFKEIKNLNRIEFSVFSCIKQNKTKKRDIDNFLFIDPDSKFKVYMREIKKVKIFDTYIQAKEYFKQNYKIPIVCMNCNYYKKCCDQYRKDKYTCIEDKIIMDELSKII